MAAALRAKCAASSSGQFAAVMNSSTFESANPANQSKSAVHGARLTRTPARVIRAGAELRRQERAARRRTGRAPRTA